ncbi:HAMP domain-containing protein [Streptomyces niveus]|uniref:HAMP domain-containing protein n=1 Tax=Streptomyces niveus TaxID=193462 RepID=UPI003691931A
MAPRQRSRPRSLGGLRARLLFSFVLVAALSALGTGALTFQQARTGVLQQSQDTVVNQFRQSVDAAVLELPSAPGQEELDSLVARLAREHRTQQWNVLATYGDLRAASSDPASVDGLTSELRASVETRPVAVFQRVRTGNHSSLVVGLPVTYSGDGYTARTLSGLTFYLIVPQKSEQAYVDALVTAVERATLPALGLAALLALLLARGVLRPVRALSKATRRMADGHFDVRLRVEGTDELADLAQAFNDTAAALEESVTELRRMEAGARRFAADISHELRTPLAAMTAVTDVLAEETPGLVGDTADAVHLITEETLRLARLVDDLMEISRFDAHAAELNLDDLDLAESLRRTLAIRGWPDDVRTDLPDGIRARVDPRRLDVVVAMDDLGTEKVLMDDAHGPHRWLRLCSVRTCHARHASAPYGWSHRAVGGGARRPTRDVSHVPRARAQRPPARSLTHSAVPRSAAAGHCGRLPDSFPSPGISLPGSGA